MPRPLPRRLSALAAAFVLGGCTDAVSPGNRVVAGDWRTESFALSPTGSYRITLSFGTDGGYAYEVHNFGLYRGQDANELSAFSRTEGTYRVQNDTLFLEPQRQIDWDSVFNRDGQIVPLTMSKTARHGTRFDITDETLVLHYLSYPADAPVETTLSFNRLR